MLIARASFADFFVECVLAMTVHVTIKGLVKRD